MLCGLSIDAYAHVLKDITANIPQSKFGGNTTLAFLSVE